MLITSSRILASAEDWKVPSFVAGRVHCLDASEWRTSNSNKRHAVITERAFFTLSLASGGFHCMRSAAAAVANVASKHTAAAKAHPNYGEIFTRNWQNDSQITLCALTRLSVAGRLLWYGNRIHKRNCSWLCAGRLGVRLLKKKEARWMLGLVLSDHSARLLTIEHRADLLIGKSQAILLSCN